MRELGTIKRRVREGIRRDRSDLIFALQLFMAGDPDLLSRAIDDRILDKVWGNIKDTGEIPSYPDIFPSIGRFGLQNHGGNNAKINVQGVVVVPSFDFRHPDAVIREYNESFIRERWVSQDWTSEFYNVAMDVETAGMGVASVGGSPYGTVDWEHVPILDFVYDPLRKTPSKWKWTVRMKRMAPEDVMDVYGDIVDEKEIKMLIDTTEGTSYGGLSGGFSADQCEIVKEYCYYSDEQHIICLGSALFGGRSILLTWDENGQYKRIENKDEVVPGPNVYGYNPHSVWVDSWLPGVGHPVGKSHDALRIASILNYVEQYIVDVVRNGRPINAIDVDKIEDTELIEKIKRTKGLDAIDKMLVMSGDIREAIKRVEPSEVSSTVMALRSILKEELNAATGVQDMQRGQALGGERRTRFEVSQFMDAAGVQARHARGRYSKFVEDVVRKTRRMALDVDTAVTSLVLPSFGSVSTSEFPIKAFMEVDMAVIVDPNSLAFKSPEQRRDEALLLWQSVLLPGIQTGTVDPVSATEWVLKESGIGDPSKLMGAPMPPMPPGGPASLPGGPQMDGLSQ